MIHEECKEFRERFVYLFCCLKHNTSTSHQVLDWIANVQYSRKYYLKFYVNRTGFLLLICYFFFCTPLARIDEKTQTHKAEQSKTVWKNQRREDNRIAKVDKQMRSIEWKSETPDRLNREKKGQQQNDSKYRYGAQSSNDKITTFRAVCANAIRLENCYRFGWARAKKKQTLSHTHTP